MQGIIIQMLDISERKASEDRVNQANRQLNRSPAASRRRCTTRRPAATTRSTSMAISSRSTTPSWSGWGTRAKKWSVGMNFRDIMLPEQVPNCSRTACRRSCATVRWTRAEYEMRRRDGSTFHALLSSSAVRDADGRFLRSNTTVVDITRRKAAETALRDNQRFLQTITDHVPGLIAYLSTRCCAVPVRQCRAPAHLWHGPSTSMLGIHVSDVHARPRCGPKPARACRPRWADSRSTSRAWRKTVRPANRSSSA